MSYQISDAQLDAIRAVCAEAMETRQALNACDLESFTQVCYDDPSWVADFANALLESGEKLVRAFTAPRKTGK